MADGTRDDERNPYAAPDAPLSDDPGPQARPNRPSLPARAVLPSCAVQATGWLMLLGGATASQSPVGVVVVCVGFAMLTLPGFYLIWLVQANRRRAG